ncbi:anthranilate synthase component I family protein [Flagellimonas flava]|uniref:Para-aminobenzoate synthetase component 1 n=1 Tax=Flagellimonas flava TaxID=570519 RepID=A0A1M5IEU6_9FLAO|nr:anthranilate synthase component I family protein [Allomuricauda flava]SHG26795.1 para-aminobenzoate synthetase component 1 [Allomuricauda flava]
MRKQRSFSVAAFQNIKEVLLDWSKPYGHIIWLDSNGHVDPYGKYDAIMAISGQNDKSFFSSKSIDKTKGFADKEKDWLFGYFSYDLKNQIENLESTNFDGLNFPELYFFQPQKIIALRNGRLIFMYLEAWEEEIDSDFTAIQKGIKRKTENPKTNQSVKVKLRIHKDAYFRKATKLLEHIHRGDIYEANFCQEFYLEHTTIDPLATYKNLNRISSAPFAAYVKHHDKFLMSASPERYLQKEGDRVISQPIKGTAPRGETQKDDYILKEKLSLDPKERSENIMIADLVRNDLSKSAVRGSVKVEELCGVYTFKQVHQMISTISANVPEGVNPIKLIKETFPMGSMTGAPKISAMKIIEELEETKRGLYSGAVGYMDPQGNFDFNVVIRSILYNETSGYVSFSVGSAFTAKSEPEKEYQECLLKAKAMRSVLEGS